MYTAIVRADLTPTFRIYNMQPCVLDLPALRAITGGDPVMEAQLFQAFEEAGENCLAILLSLAAQDPQGRWQIVVHQLGRGASSLRALRLADLCEEAQHLPRDTDLRNAACEAIAQACAELSAEFSQLLPK